MTAAIAAPCRFEHDAFIYSSDSSYVETLVPLIRETLTHGEVVMVVVPARKARLLRGALGVEVSGVRFVDSARWYRHPIETLSGYDDVVGGLGAGERAFVIGEVEFGTTESE